MTDRLFPDAGLGGATQQRDLGGRCDPVMRAIQKEELEIQTAWAPKLAKIVQDETVARFFRIENELDAIMGLEPAAGIPLVERHVKGRHR